VTTLFQACQGTAHEFRWTSPTRPAQAPALYLPTGNPLNRIEVSGLGILDVSLVDIGNAHVFVRAADCGLDGTETAQAIDADEKLIKTLERVRAYADATVGMVEDPERARALSPATPLIAMVAPVNDYENALAGETVPAHAADFLSRLMFMQQMHKTYAGTSTVCTGIASRLEGTLVHSMSRPETRDAPVVSIGHRAGVIETESTVELEGNGYRVTRATLGRTARRILQGRVFTAP
jgi:2-methylaconitate cis-trans-isomerase PrpF